MTDIKALVERLKKNRNPGCSCPQCSGDLEAAAELTRLDAECADWKHRAEKQWDAAQALAVENKRLMEALEIIAGKRQCMDNLMSHVEIARAALTGGADD